MNESVIEECRELLHIRWMRQRRPKFFYVAPDVWLRLHTEMAQMQRYTDWPVLLNRVQLFDCEVKEFDFPAGYILCSETRLH